MRDFTLFQLLYTYLEEQRIIIGQWIDSINALNGAYTEVVFRMAMQLSFSILVQLADWK